MSNESVEYGTRYEGELTTFDGEVKPERVQPVIVNGVKFYVSRDGSQAGLSQRGVERLCGVSESQMRSLLKSLSSNEGIPPIGLEELKGTNIYLPLSGNHAERVVCARVAAKIIEYYAFDAVNRSELALYTFRAFSTMGLEQWIKDTAGFKPEITATTSDGSETNTLLRVLLDEVKEMRGQLAVTAGYRNAVPSMPGLGLLMETYKPDSQRQALLARGEDKGDLYTMNEWLLETHGVVLNRQDKHTMALNVSTIYKAMMLEPPVKVTRRNDKGVLISPVAGYPRKHFGILQASYTQMLMGRPTRRPG